MPATETVKRTNAKRAPESFICCSASSIEAAAGVVIIGPFLKSVIA